MSNKESAESFSALSISFWVFVSSSLPSSLQPAYFSHLQSRIALGYIPAHHPGRRAILQLHPTSLVLFLSVFSPSRTSIHFRGLISSFILGFTILAYNKPP